MHMTTRYIFTLDRNEQTIVSGTTSYAENKAMVLADWVQVTMVTGKVTGVKVKGLRWHSVKGAGKQYIELHKVDSTHLPVPVQQAIGLMV